MVNKRRQFTTHINAGVLLTKVYRDIGEIMSSWEYKPNSINVRKIIGDDGKEKIQIRVALGILQMEVYGRPDGKTPNGEESLLDYYQSFFSEFGVPAEGFNPTEQDKKELDAEIMQYYHRRICFFALKDYILARRDAEHNIQLMDIISTYFGDKDYVQFHEQFRPFIIMEKTRAASLECLNNEDHAGAMMYIGDAIDIIENFYRGYGIDEDDIRKSPELMLLRKWRAKIHQDWEGGIAEIDDFDVENE